MTLPFHTPYRVLSIDPGTNHMGVCLSTISHTGDTGLVPGISIESAFTKKLSSIKNYHKLDNELYENKKYRLLQIQDFIERYVADVDVVAIEAPFFYFKKPIAFAALIETMTCLEYNVLRFKPNTPIVRIEPLLVKKIIAAKSFTSKEEVISALYEIVKKSEEITCSIDISKLDEHAIDAIAVGLAFYYQHELYQKLNINII